MYAHLRIKKGKCAFFSHSSSTAAAVVCTRGRVSHFVSRSFHFSRLARWDLVVDDRYSVRLLWNISKLLRLSLTGDAIWGGGGYCMGFHGVYTLSECETPVRWSFDIPAYGSFISYRVQMDGKRTKSDFRARKFNNSRDFTWDVVNYADVCGCFVSCCNEFWCV